MLHIHVCVSADSLYVFCLSHAADCEVLTEVFMSTWHELKPLRTRVNIHVL